MDPKIQKLASLILDALGSDSSVVLKKMIDDEDWVGIINYTIDPKHYTRFTDFGPDYCAAELLRKYPAFPVEIDRKKAARQTFWEAEKQCYRTNQFLSRFIHGTSVPDMDPLAEFLRRVRKRVGGMIGSGPGSFTREGGFGPGATYGNRGKLVLIPDKLEGRPQATRDAWDYLPVKVDYLNSRFWDIHKDIPEQVTGNRFTTVPKTSKTDRGICIEPVINLFYQKGLGAVMRRRLKKSGLDIQHGQPRNGVLATFGSETGQYATIDLSAASDTVCTALVRLCVPRRWFESLYALRSARTEIDGKVVLLEKFSSMGNGYTFELETCLFAAIAAEVMVLCGVEPRFGHNVLVYGDDIVVPSKVYGLLTKTLSSLGFIPNPKKSFNSGYFRESCGTDAFGGQVVRPFRIDSEDDGLQFWLSSANRLKVMFKSLDLWSPKALKAWRYCVSQVPTRHRLFGPERLGDICIHDGEESWIVRDGSNFPDRSPLSIPGTKWCRVNSVRTKPIPWSHWKDDVTLAARVFQLGDHSLGCSGRGCITSLGLSWVSVS